MIFAEAQIQDRKCKNFSRYCTVTYTYTIRVLRSTSHLFRRVLLVLVTDSEPVKVTGSENRWSPKYLVARSRLGKFVLMLLELVPGFLEEWDGRTCFTSEILKQDQLQTR